METEKLWNPNIHAYRRNHSTTTALGDLTDVTLTARDKNLISVAMGVDETAAFDCISHKILIEKMRAYNFHPETVTWMSSYLEFRSSYIAIGGHNSRIEPVSRGVPQGSILGPSYSTSMSTNFLTSPIGLKTARNLYMKHLNISSTSTAKSAAVSHVMQTTQCSQWQASQDPKTREDCQQSCKS